MVTQGRGRRAMFLWALTKIAENSIPSNFTKVLPLLYTAFDCLDRGFGLLEITCGIGRNVWVFRGMPFRSNLACLKLSRL